MVKSRQRKYPILKSQLNFIRESFIFTCSFCLWSYCIGMVLILALIATARNDYHVQLLRTVMNVEYSHLLGIIRNVVLIIIVLTVYLIISFIVNARIRRGYRNEAQ